MTISTYTSRYTLDKGLLDKYEQRPSISIQPVDLNSKDILGTNYVITSNGNGLYGFKVIRVDGNNAAVTILESEIRDIQMLEILSLPDQVIETMIYGSIGNLIGRLYAKMGWSFPGEEGFSYGSNIDKNIRDFIFYEMNRIKLVREFISTI